MARHPTWPPTFSWFFAPTTWRWLHYDRALRFREKILYLYLVAARNGAVTWPTVWLWYARTFVSLSQPPGDQMASMGAHDKLTLCVMFSICFYHRILPCGQYAEYDFMLVFLEIVLSFNIKHYDYAWDILFFALMSILPIFQRSRSLSARAHIHLTGCSRLRASHIKLCLRICLSLTCYQCL